MDKFRIVVDGDAEFEVRDDTPLDETPLAELEAKAIALATERARELAAFNLETATVHIEKWSEPSWVKYGSVIAVFSTELTLEPQESGKD